MIYFLLVDRFANGDPSNDGAVDRADPQAFHGGDLQGVIDRLDHIRGLGADTVWLGPVFAMRTEPFYGHGAFHGYWVEDIAQVEPRFGDEATLRRLADELHRRDMKLLLDVVWNHVAPEGELTRTHPEWFHEARSVQDWSDPVEATTGQVHGLPDLAQEREPVYRHLADVSLGWIDRVGPDGFRVDAVRHMPLSFLSRIAADIHAKAGPDFTLLGEVFDGAPPVVAAAARDGGMNALFDFPLHFAMVDVFCKGEPPGALGAILSQDDAYPAGTELVTFLDNHDRPRILSACDGDVSRVSRALDFQFSVRGTPSLTWGTEAGLAGAGEPENRADMRFGETETYRHIARLMERRRAHPALRAGEIRHLALDADLYAFAQVTDGETMFVAVNQGDTPRRVSRHVVPPRSVEVWAGEAPPAPAPVTVRVQATHPATHPGDTLLLVGAGKALGDWDPGKGIALPATVTLDPEVHAFKLVLRRADGTVAWEEGGNRYLLPDRKTRRVTLAWRPTPSPR